MAQDDIDLNEFEQTEEPGQTPGNGREPETTERTVDESIIASDTLISAAKRMGGFGLQGETRRAFEDEFGGLARLLAKIFGVDDASKIMSLKGSLSDETRLVGGILSVAGSAALWRFVINKDIEKGGDVESTFSGETTTKSPGDNKETKDTEQTSQGSGDEKSKAQIPGDFTSFHDLDKGDDD